MAVKKDSNEIERHYVVSFTIISTSEQLVLNPLIEGSIDSLITKSVWPGETPNLTYRVKMTVIESQPKATLLSLLGMMCSLIAIENNQLPSLDRLNYIREIQEYVYGGMEYALKAIEESKYSIVDLGFATRFSRTIDNTNFTLSFKQVPDFQLAPNHHSDSTINNS